MKTGNRLKNWKILAAGLVFMTTASAVTAPVAASSLLSVTGESQIRPIEDGAGKYILKSDGFYCLKEDGSKDISPAVHYFDHVNIDGTMLDGFYYHDETGCFQAGSSHMVKIAKLSCAKNSDEDAETVDFDGYYMVNNLGKLTAAPQVRYISNYVIDNTTYDGDYYFDENGKMATGWHTIKSTTYHFNKKGIMQTGWQKNGSDKYYMTKSGGAVTGWQKIGKNTYYFENDGKMVTGEVNIGLSVCKFDKKGNLISKKAGKVDPKKPMVALTFDDGPGPRTLELLKALEKYNAHATFFMVGQNVSIHKDALKKMKEIGCELGNHSYNHANLSKQDAKGLKDQVDKTNDLIKGIVGRGATVLRPPYGAIGGVMHEKVKMPMILWNIDTLDWKTRNAQKTIETVMNNVGDGDIVLMHDIHTESVDAALKLIPKLEKEGYQLVTISEMAEAKGQKLENGEKYCDFTAKTLSRAKENQESEE